MDGLKKQCAVVAWRGLKLETSFECGKISIRTFIILNIYELFGR